MTQNSETEASPQWCASDLSLPPEMTSTGLLRSPDPPLKWHHSQLESFMALAASCQLDKLEFTQSCQKLAETAVNQVNISPYTILNTTITQN